MLILSPRWASLRISAQFDIVKEVPPPPADESSRFSKEVMAGFVSLAKATGRKVGLGSKHTANSLNYTGEHHEQRGRTPAMNDSERY